MKKPIIALFCQGNEPTAEEFALLKQYSHYNIVAYNVANLAESDVLVMDGVCGATPTKYQHFPAAEDLIAEYEQYLSNLGAGVGGLAPEHIEDEIKDETKNLDLDQKDTNSDTGFNN